MVDLFLVEGGDVVVVFVAVAEGDFSGAVLGGHDVDSVPDVLGHGFLEVFFEDGEAGAGLEGAVVSEGESGAEHGAEVPVCAFGAHHLEFAADESGGGVPIGVEGFEVLARTDIDVVGVDFLVGGGDGSFGGF